jgi:hypothetical protein
MLLAKRLLRYWKGLLRGGGYRYYFKYSTQEGNTTEILYESPLIPISNAGLGLNKDQVSDRMIQFTLTELDSSALFILRTLTAETRQPWRSLKINYVFFWGT